MRPVDLLADALERAPFDLKVRVVGNAVKVKAPTMPETTLRAVSAGEGWPSDVRSLLNEVGAKWRSDLVAVAPRFSPGAVRVLLNAGANWADSAGGSRIAHPPLFISRFPNGSETLGTLPEDRELKWSRSLIDLVEWLLLRPNVLTGVTEAARALGWSPPLVSRGMRTLEGHGWLTSAGRGPSTKRALSNPGSLLEAWSTAVAKHPPRSRQAYVLMPSTEVFIRSELGTLLQGAPHALTGWAAASILAPHAGLTPSVHVYVESLNLERLWQRWMDAANPPARPVNQGANLVLLEADKHVLKHSAAREGLSVASPPRVYADLLPLGGRAVDAAAHLREVAIGF